MSLRVLVASLVALMLGLTACSDDPEPIPAPEPSPTTAAPSYDPDLEPAAAVLALVPDGATRLAVTDYEQVRLQLGKPTLSSASPARERIAFWAGVDDETAVLTEGVLRPVRDRLAEEYGFTQADVEWEAQFAGDESGYLLKFTDAVDMGAVQRAVDDGVGPLAGATVAADERVIGTNPAPSTAESWAAEEDLRELVGEVAVATYVQRDCLPFDQVFGAGVLGTLAEAPAEDVAALDELGPFSVTFGAGLATARLGAGREDVFDRARLAETLPATVPEFGTAFRRPVADPAGGRIGYTLGDPVAAAALTVDQTLPFAVCAD